MTYHEPTHSDSDELTDESPATDARYAAVTTENGAVLYDRENESAWIESDTTCDRQELI